MPTKGFDWRIHVFGVGLSYGSITQARMLYVDDCNWGQQSLTNT